MEKQWIAFVVAILAKLLDLATPQIRQLLKDALLDLYKKAKATPSPIDNVLLEALLLLLGIEIPSD